MESDRANFETLWQEVADNLLPRQADFLGSTMLSQGARRTDRIFDEWAMLALDHGVAVFEGEVIPQGGQWQKLQARDPALMKNLRVRVWFEQLTDRLFALRNSPYSGFANQTHESVASLMSFGNQGMWTDHLLDPLGRPVGLSYRSEHIGQIFVEENHQGEVDISHRKFSLTARQAVGKWGAKAPECAIKGMRDKRPDDKHTYLHVLQPNAWYQPGRLDAAGKPVSSCYVSMGERQLFDDGGYRTKPLTYSRYEKSPTETYGRGPAMNVLPAVKATQAMMRDLITATEFMAMPALLAHDDMQDQTLFYSPGGVSYGGLDDRGNPMVKRVMEDVDLSQALVLQQRTRDVIDRAFFVDLYQIRQEVKTHVSATEIMQRQAEKGILLAPLLRQQTEWFTPIAERELDLMNELGLLDDMPPELVEAGGIYQIVYENPLTRARKADEAAGFYQMLQGVTPLIQMDPTLGAEFLKKYPFGKVLGGLGYIHGVPASWEATDDERAAADAQEQSAQDTATALDVGDRASVIAKNLGQAQLAGAAV